MIKRVFVLVAILTISFEAFGDSYYRNRTIVGAGIYYSGNISILLFGIDGDKSGMVPCASSGRFTINSNAPHYKEIVSLVLTAYASKQNTVDLYVTESCNYFGNAQDVLGVKMGDIPW